MKGVKRYVLIIGAAIVTVALVKMFLLDSYSIKSEKMCNTLKAGDYVLVNKLKLKNNPGNNRLVLYKSPLRQDVEHPPLFLGRCLGMPGEHIRVGEDGFRVNGYLLNNASMIPSVMDEYGEGYEFIIPRKNGYIDINPVTLTICKDAILSETGKTAMIKDDKLYINGKEKFFYFFHRNYYWVVSENEKDGIDSRHLGLIPEDYIVGNVWFCWFSRDSNRLFHKIK
ncbi:MAG: signal peptidase I [Tannerella sp.]|jgi:signal peptidase I|nr:signal peptidase I [Tannerella sp.]